MSSRFPRSIQPRSAARRSFLRAVGAGAAALPFYPLLEAFITSGPVIALVAEGPQAVAVVRGMMGPTNGAQAPPGTIRGDFGLSRQMNLMHGSDSVEAAQKEIAVYFRPDELVSYDTTLAPWVCAADEAK